MTTIQQEIKALKVGQEKIFKVDFESAYITIRKSKLKGLEIIIDDDTGTYEVGYYELTDNFTNFALYQENKIDY